MGRRVPRSRKKGRHSPLHCLPTLSHLGMSRPASYGFLLLSLHRRKQAQKATWLCSEVTPRGDRLAGLLACSASPLSLATAERRAGDQTRRPSQLERMPLERPGAGLTEVLSYFPSAPVLTSAPRLVRQREAPPPTSSRARAPVPAHQQAPPPLPWPALPQSGP